MLTNRNSPQLADCRTAELSDARAQLERTYQRMADAAAQAVFIETVPYESALEQLQHRQRRKVSGVTQPLFGVPFAVKDNFDVAGMPTTAACPAFAYHPERTAAAVELLLDAGAILIGKTNLDQFATGLVGIRSPYGICRCAVDADYIAGGSSSGSALAVALGIVPFALGTDTAGSGRVPAAFNHLVGLKPTRGLVSTRGVVPACRSLDCVSLFTHCVDDAAQLLDILARFDSSDPFSRSAPSMQRETPAALRVGIPEHLEFFGNRSYKRLFNDCVERLKRVRCSRVAVEIGPFVEAGHLLYGGPWVAERYASVGHFVEAQPESVHPTVRQIVLSGKEPAAHELFRAQYELASIRRQLESVWAKIDLLVLPTTGTIYRVDAVLADPIALNSNLGRYTNFVNLLDLSALALPFGSTPEGLPFGISLIAPAFADATLLRFAKELLT